MIETIISILLACPTLFTIIGFVISVFKSKGDSKVIKGIAQEIKNNELAYNIERQSLIKQQKELTAETRALVELLKRQRELHPEDFPEVK